MDFSKGKESPIDKFWLYIPLKEMSRGQWESLCDGCAKCCLEKLEDWDTKEVFTTKVSCRLLDLKDCKCSKYNERFKYMDDCIKLTPKNVYEIKWLPKTCAYRLVKEKKDLPPWHPLITKDPMSTVKSGNSAKKFAIHPAQMNKSIVEYILDSDV